MDPVQMAMMDGADLRVGHLAQTAPARCDCCGHLPPAGTVAGLSLCTTCLPAFALDEYDIDCVTRLIWCPLFDQGALSRLVTALQAVSAKHETTLWSQELSGEPLAAKRVFDTLKKQCEPAVSLLGTDRPSRLRAAARALPRRPDHALSGIRCLTVSTWFAKSPAPPVSGTWEIQTV